MFAADRIEAKDKNRFFQELSKQLSALLDGEVDAIANAANTTALIFQQVPDLNWAGFYFMKSPDQLVLGPFQGRPACVRISVGRGVCGTAAERRQTLRVTDVDTFPGHIACDAASRSELVVPLLSRERILGVLDLDSPHPGRFDAVDQAGLERLAAIFVAASHWET